MTQAEVDEVFDAMVVEHLNNCTDYECPCCRTPLAPELLTAEFFDALAWEHLFTCNEEGCWRCTEWLEPDHAVVPIEDC